MELLFLLNCNALNNILHTMYYHKKVGYTSIIAGYVMQKKTIDTKYSEKYIVWRNSLGGSDILSTKDRITIEDNLFQTLRVKMLVLDLSNGEGPCRVVRSPNWKQYCLIRFQAFCL
ncbi:MAG: hypothetical protein B2I17_07635 [Thermoplasmatales archaeon B_DKE]|nr:MAG: hypothetical protein B2I17_07635 [Thermoplasmatales archaeon B_DKE]